MRFRSYRSWAKQLCPPWLRGNWGARLVDTAALTLDLLGELAVEAGDSSMLESPSFAPDALGLIGAQRLLERYAGETDAGYKARVRGAWVAWPQAGTRQGILAQLSAAGLTATIKEVFTARRATVQPADEMWNWDGDEANWSRFWVVITGHPWSSALWGATPVGSGHHWGDGWTWGSSATGKDIAALRGIVRKWKPAHAVCSHIVVVHDLTVWNASQPDGTWGDFRNRNHGAMYIPG